MHNKTFSQAEQFLKLGLYPQAFETFMSLEVGAGARPYLFTALQDGPCKSA